MNENNEEARKRISLLLVDDQILFLESLKLVLETRAEDMEVIGVAHDGEEAVEMVEKLSPDIVLLDVRMPGVDGVQAARGIHEKGLDTSVIMLTTFDDDEYVSEALECGAVGYLLKDMPPADLISAVRSVSSGRVMFSSAIANKLVSRVRSNSMQQAPSKPDSSRNSSSGFAPQQLLRRREYDIFQLLVAGYDNREIAEELALADQTVKNHVSEIYSKLGVHDRLHLMRLARSRGWE